MQQSHQSLDEWLRYLETIHPLSMDFKLKRIQTVYERLNLGKIAPLVITIAGTNGKGSTATTCSYLFESHGAKVGLFTSPHIFKFNERIRIDQTPANDADIIEAFIAINVARADITLTYFEFATLAAFYCFKKANVDVAILEVGLGGRLDSTNIIDADIALITPIGIDHTAQLGNTIDEIAFEKAGIIKPNRLAVTAEEMPSRSIQTAADSRHSTLYTPNQDYRYLINDNHHWNYQFKNEPELRLNPPSLIGLHQYQNAATALTALYLSSYQVKESRVNDALSRVQLMGRFQKMSAINQPDLYLDVTHNPQGAAILKEILSSLPENPKEANPDQPKRKIIAIYGALKDKDSPTVATILDQTIDHWFCCTLDNDERGLSALDLINRINPFISRPITIADSIEIGCEKAISFANKDDILILFGSFHMMDRGYNWFGEHGYA